MLISSCVVQPFSKYLPRTNDISFWLPETGFSSNDFYDLVRSIGGDTVLKVKLNDVYTSPESQSRTSHCYSITYQLPDAFIRQADVAVVHSRIAAAATQLLGVEIRWYYQHDQQPVFCMKLDRFCCLNCIMGIQGPVLVNNASLMDAQV